MFSARTAARFMAPVMNGKRRIRYLHIGSTNAGVIMLTQAIATVPLKEPRALGVLLTGF